MNLIDRIAAALGNNRVRIHADVFEECATDLLQERYPNLVPVRGGSDSGRDADSLQAPGTPPVRMAITSSRSYEGAKKNLRLAMDSLEKHGMSGKTIISVSLAELNQDKRKKFEDLATSRGFSLETVVDRAFFADRLRSSGDWREKLLGLPGGPFSLSRYSVRGDIRPRDFEIVGRAVELDAIQNSSGDLLLYGVPGVGKSALLEKTPELYFVDGNPTIDRLMDDVMASQPAILVVDDAPRRLDMLENLQQIRRQESLAFRIIAVCWPHQRDELKVHMGDAAEMQILPLIRSDIGVIVRNGGITRESLIARILDQAKGRPAWAARLVDLVQSDAQWREVQTGEAVRGEVSQYLIRSGLSKEARDVLAAIAILGTVAESEIAVLASQLEISRTTVVHLIDDLAVGGLLDVHRQWTRQGTQENVYSVAPQILATSIVIDTFFGTGPAVFPVVELFESWPSKQTSIAVHCISASLLGVSGAYPIARSLFNDLAARSAISVGSDIYRYYLHLGANEAREIVQRAIAEWEQSADESQFRQHAILDLIATYFADAIRDMGLVAMIDDALNFAARLNDEGLTQRLLSHLIDEIRNASIPDGSINLAPLFSIWEAAIRWHASETAEVKERVLTALLRELLNPAFETSTLSPENHRLLRLISVVLPADSMRLVVEQIWAPYSSTVSRPTHEELSLLAGLFRKWVLIAQGFSPGFGGEISPEQMDVARRLAESLADYLIANSGAYPGIRATVRRFSKGIDRQFPESDSLIAALFFISDDEEGDWHERREKYEQTLNRAVQRGLQQPLKFMKRIIEIRPHMADWDQPLTNPMFTIFRLMAQADTELLPLVQVAAENDLFPEAGPLVGALLSQSDVDDAVLTALLDDPNTRPFVVGHALGVSPPDDYLDRIIDRLAPSDVADVLAPVSSDPSSLSIADRLLEHDDLAVRASYAAAILINTDGDLESVLPAETVLRVREALKELTVPIQIGFRDSTYLLERVIACCPDVYEHLLGKAMGPPSNENIYNDLQPFAGTAPMLGADAKTRVLLTREAGTRERRHLLNMLRGNDIDWLETLLEAGLIDADQVESTFNGLGGPIPIEGLARLLVPRGTSPLTIAVKVELGSQWGEQHERLEGYLERMRILAESNDPRVAAVGEAGVHHYQPLVDEARVRFREAQVRGDL